MHKKNCVFFVCRETNLKVKQALPETTYLEDNHEEIASFRGTMHIIIM